MPLNEFQYILNRLYTEEAFRQRFFGNKDAFYNSETIENKETQNLLNSLKQEQIEFFANGLLAKRKHAVNDLIPGTIKLLGTIHHSLFQEFSQTYLPSGIHKHHQDALAYCRFLQTKLRPEKELRTLLRFEANCLQHFLHPIALSLQFFRHHPLHLKSRLIKGSGTTSTFSPTLVVWKNGSIHRVISSFKK